MTTTPLRSRLHFDTAFETDLEWFEIEVDPTPGAPALARVVDVGGACISSALRGVFVDRFLVRASLGEGRRPAFNDGAQLTHTVSRIEHL